MAYWGDDIADNDFAFEAVGSYVMHIRKAASQSADSVVVSGYPEQSILASLRCIRLLAGPFRKTVKVSFGRKDYEALKAAFETWYLKANKKVPAKYREKLRSLADEEFRLFEIEVLGPKPGT